MVMVVRGNGACRSSSTTTALVGGTSPDALPIPKMGIGAQMPFGSPLPMMESITSHLCSSRRHALILPSKARLLIYVDNDDHDHDGDDDDD